MIYIQSYHSGVVARAQFKFGKTTQLEIPARESLERPLVCMRRWLSASVVTAALSTPCLLQSRLGHDQCSSRSVCMHGVSVLAVLAWCHILPNVQGGLCSQSRSGLALATSPIAAFCSWLSSPNPVTGMLAALVPPGLGHQPVPTSRAQVCHIYQSGYIPP